MVTIPTIDMVKTGQHIMELAAWYSAADNRQSGRAGGSAWRKG